MTHSLFLNTQPWLIYCFTQTTAISHIYLGMHVMHILVAMVAGVIDLFACWVSFHAFVVVCCLFSELLFLKNSLRNTFRVSNGLDPDQDRHFISPDMGINCLQRLSTDDKSCP